MFNFKVTTDAVPDLTSMDALVKSITKPGMTDEEKCLAGWRAVYEHRFWNPESRGATFNCATDPILILNCFAPTICQQDSEMCVAVWNALGFSGRVYQIIGHTTSEVFYGEKWRFMDATSGGIVRDDKGEIVPLAEKHKWTGGPSRIGERSFVAHTDGFVVGHRMELALRRGESFRRHWGPLSKDEDYWTPASDGKRPVDRLKNGKSCLQRTMDLRPRQFEAPPPDAAYANGVWSWEPRLAEGLAGVVEDSRNVEVFADGGRAVLRPAKAGAEGWAVFRIRSPYVISGGWLTATVARGPKDSVKLQTSVNGGKTWSDLWASQSADPEKIKVPLRTAVGCSFEYLVKVCLAVGDSTVGVRIGDLRFETIVQLNPFALPALKLGKTAVTVAAGPQLDSITINPNLDKPSYRAEIEAEENVCTARESKQDGWVHGVCAKEPDKESYVIFKLRTPGDARSVRLGGQFLGGNDANKLYYSFDGKAWTEAPFTYRQAPKASANSLRTVIADYETIDPLPAGTRTIWVKFWFMRKGPIKDPYHLSLATALRIDAQYAPAAPPVAAPVDVVYHWVERTGEKLTERTHTQTIDKYPTTYTVDVGGDREPFMKWIEVRTPPRGTSGEQAK